MENFVISSCLVGHTLSLYLALTQYSCTSHMCRLPISLTSPTTPTRSHLLLHSLFLIHVTREGSFTLSLSHPSISHIYRFSLSLSLVIYASLLSLWNQNLCLHNRHRWDWRSLAVVLAPKKSQKRIFLVGAIRRGTFPEFLWLHFCG